MNSIAIGMNSIAAYLIAQQWERFAIDSRHIHLGREIFQILARDWSRFSQDGQS